MRDPIQKYFQIGLVSSMAYAPVLATQSWPSIVHHTVSDGYFNAVELNPLSNSDTCRQIRALTTQGHMALYYNAHGRLLSANLNPNDMDEVKRQTAEASLLAGVDEAVLLGSPTMGILSGHWTEETREDSLCQLIKTITHVCRYALKQKILIELEVFDYNIAKKSLLGPASLAARFASEIRSRCSNFGLMVDLSHFPMTYETSSQVIETLRPYITHFHIGNTVVNDSSAPAYGDEHPRFGFPGSSNDTEQLLDYLRILRKNGFFCPDHPYPLTFEVKPWSGEDVEIVLASSKRVLNRAWALLEE